RVWRRLLENSLSAKVSCWLIRLLILGSGYNTMISHLGLIRTFLISFNGFVTCTILQNRVFCNQTGEDEYGEFESGYSGRRARHAYAAGHKGNSKGNAADR
ncbi:hypothetical protein, partial [Klebsiella pneumoniae]|uniref:hypothetical protein n=1 Tax=Klebsiella pneumoniae TaxID=573 RepID=UPI001E644AF6